MRAHQIITPCLLLVLALVGCDDKAPPPQQAQPAAGKPSDAAPGPVKKPEPPKAPQGAPPVIEHKTPGAGEKVATANGLMEATIPNSPHQWGCDMGSIDMGPVLLTRIRCQSNNPPGVISLDVEDLQQEDLTASPKDITTKGRRPAYERTYKKLEILAEEESSLGELSAYESDYKLTAVYPGGKDAIIYKRERIATGKRRKVIIGVELTQQDQLEPIYKAWVDSLQLKDKPTSKVPTGADVAPAAVLRTPIPGQPGQAAPPAPNTVPKDQPAPPAPPAPPSP